MADTLQPVETSLTPAIQGELGQRLKEHYARLLAEPLPAKFTSLLQQLAKSERKV